MSLLNSLLFGSEGSYQIFDIPVKFHKKISLSEKTDHISQLAIKCGQSRAFCWCIQGYLHIFTHEMGHALAYKFFTEKKPKITILIHSCTGVSKYSEEIGSLPAWKQTVIDSAGPMAQMALSSCKLAGVILLKNYLPFPIRVLLGGGAAFCMSAELVKAAVSASLQDEDDFGLIAQRGKKHLGIASLALITECALGIFAAVKLL